MLLVDFEDCMILFTPNLMRAKIHSSLVLWTMINRIIKLGALLIYEVANEFCYQG